MRSVFILLIFLVLSCQDRTEKKPSDLNSEINYDTPFEKGNGNQTATYQEVIDYYQKLADEFSTITIDEIGLTDSGEPLHLISFSQSKIDWNIPNSDYIKILINNGIHPGESDGIDATMMLFRDLAVGNIEAPENLILNAIAVYNVGGSLNRNSTTRTNQNGPEDYGFRGNARNYDLNRDFIKSDTYNAFAFYEVFHKIHPDIFIDNHVSNGADYQYTLTHLFSQHSKMANQAGDYLHQELQPELESRLKKRGWDITPYVNVWGRTPDQGFSQFMDHPRYSTGYTALWNTLGMMVETHMLKPYEDRVKGTKVLMEEMISIGSENINDIKKVRLASLEENKRLKYYPFNYVVDTTRADTLTFKGYKGVQAKSEITGNNLLTYNRKAPFEKNIPYSNYFKATDSIKIPSHYIIPSGQWEIIDRLRANDIQMDLVPKDTVLKVSRYKISKYNTSDSPYEGHYPHSNVEVKEELANVRFRESDILIPTSQPGIKYIIETLEPEMADSFFKWNFFDTILQQKEGFSSYVFEATAKELIAENADLKKEFDSIKNADEEFSKSNNRQLDWLHKRSPNYEAAHLTYPIYRLFE
ncbi:MAG: M14 family metallopeptidase [Nonlabens sp.]